MESYTSQELSKQKPWQKYASMIIGAILVGFGIYLGDGIMIAMGAVLIYIMIYKKTVIVDEEGMTIHYNFVFYRKTSRYPYSEFTEIRAGVSPNNETNVGFVKSGMTYPVLLTTDEAERAIEMVLEQIPSMPVKYYVPKPKKFRL